MKRKTVLTGGLILALLYSLMLLASVILLVVAVFYTITNNNIQVIKDILNPILTPLMVFGKDMLILTVGIVFLVSLFSLICASRFIKYSDFNNEKFVAKKSLYIFYLVWFCLLCALYLYFLIENVVSSAFGEHMLENILLIVLVALHIPSIIVLCVGVSKAKPYKKQQDDEKQDEIQISVDTDTSSDAQDLTIKSDNPVLQEDNKNEETKTKEKEKEEEKVQPDVNWSDYIYHDEEDNTPQEIQIPSRPPIYTAGLDEDDDEIQTFDNPPITEKPAKKVRPLPESNTTKQVINGISKLDAMRKSGQISATQYTKLRNKLIRKLTKNI